MGWTAAALAQNPPATDNALNAALYQACEDGKLDQVRALVEQKGASVNGQTGDLGFTPLMAAAADGHLDVLTYLISKDANLNFPDHEGSTPLLHACWNDHPDCALALISAGENVNLDSNAGRTPLMYAAMHGDDPVVTALIARKARLDDNCSEGPPILWAAANDKLSTVMLLGEAGAKLDLLPMDNPKKFSLLAMAVSYNDVKMIDYLLQRGANVNLPDGDGATPLMVASEYGWGPATQHLLDAQAKVDLQNDDGNTALMLVRDPALTAMLLPQHPDLELKNKKGMTALLQAAYLQDLVQVRALVEAGADVNATDLRGETALTIAGDTGDLSIVSYLQQKGARRTAIHIIDKGTPSPPPTPPQAWALAVGAIYTQRDGLNPKVLGGDLIIQDQEKVVLKRDWGISDRASLLQQTKELHDHGHHLQYQQQGLQLSRMTDAQFNQLLADHPAQAARIQAIKANYLKWKDRSGLAWDLCRSAMLVNKGYAIGYLSEQEAWDQLMAIARQTQGSFASWKEMSDNFLDGREIWADQRDARFEACAQLLLNPNEPNSPWNQVAWKTDLSSAAGGPSK